MPAKVPGTHKITVLRSFCHRLAERAAEGNVVEDRARREGLGVEDIDLSGLSSKALTLLMQGRHREDPKEFKVRRKDRRHVRAFLACSRAEQFAILSRLETWVYPDNVGVRAADIRILDAVGAEDEETEPSNLGQAAGFFEEEVDWGCSEDEEELEPEKEEAEEEIAFGPVDNYAPPPLKRRRGKQSDTLLDAGWKAVIGTSDLTCRLAQELHCPVLCVPFGMQSCKPPILRRWGALHETCDSVQLLAGRENGNFYYAARPLNASPSASWLLENGGTLEKVYCRMPLLLSTLQRRITAILFAESLPEEKNACGVDPRDGMAEMSLAFAERHGLIGAAGGCYNPFQFRGFFKLQNEDGLTCLAKGMAVINAALPAETFILPDSCIKVRGPPLGDDTCYGFDITSETRPMAQPRLTASLFAMLQARIALHPDSRRRKALTRRLSNFVQACKDHTWELFKERAFGIDGEGRQVVKAEEHTVRASPETIVEDPWPKRRVDLHEVDLEIGAGHELPTPLTHLEMEEEECNPHFFNHRTRESLARGSVALWGNYVAHQRKPRLHIPHTGATVTALSDYTDTLEDKECYVIAGGKNLVGEVLVWRCPCQCPWDLEVWHAKEIPAGLFGEGGAPEEVVLISRKGHGNSRMAGGDYDGDLDMLCFDDRLIYLVKQTQPAVNNCREGDLDLQVQLRMVLAADKLKEEAEAEDEEEGLLASRAQQKRDLDTEFGGRSKQRAYKRFCLWLPTPRLRGWACAMAERVCAEALKSRTPDAWEHFFNAALTAHKAMDVPKHYTAESLVAVMQGVLADSGVAKRGPRVTKAVCSGVQGLRLTFSSLKRHNTFEEVADWLTLKQPGPYGAIWLPYKEVVLGEEAADRVWDILRTRPKHLNYFERSVTRRPIVEVAGYVAHKLSRSIGEPSQYPGAGGGAIAKAIQGTKKLPMNTTGALYRSTFLQ